MVMTDPAAVPGPPLVARPWPRMAELLADRTPGPDLLDWAIAVVCFIGFTLPVLADGGTTRMGAEAAFGAMASAPLIVRRRWPVPVVLAITAVYAAATLAGVAFTPLISNAGPNLAIAVFTAADRSRPRWSLTATTAAAAVTWASLPVAMHLHPQHGQDAVQLVAAILAWPAGYMVRAVHGYRRQLQLLERRRAVEELQLARAEERLRLTREVHDVVSHSLSAIAVQAGVARLVLAEQPGQAGAALSAIETASRSALDELRALLRQIRDPEDADEVATPTLAALPSLIDRLRRAGLHVTCHSTGQPRQYSGAVEFSAYRIVQEALTNVTKHASGARTRVEVDHGTDSLTITVTDNGSPDGIRPAAKDGLGIPGMRERAALLGGTLSAAPGPDGGFTVTARLPAGKGKDGTGPRPGGLK